MVGGYAGNILKIDLTNRLASSVPLPDGYRKRLLGGKALAAQLLCDGMTGQEAALSEENPVVVATALLTGTDAPGSSRFDMAALSPKDGMPVFSNCGGAFGVLLKKAGYDALIIKGRCDRPGWLQISEKSVVFCDARPLWGSSTGKCAESLRQSLKGQPSSVVCIGPAGEHLVKYASVLADGHSMGRGGLGAVLGWKQLKAIVVGLNEKTGLPAQTGFTEENQNGYGKIPPAVSGGTEEGRCNGCFLRCVRHGRETDPRLNELGLDAIEAEAALGWAAERGMDVAGLYDEIAFRRGIGDLLAEGVERNGKKGGKRRKVSYDQLAAVFDLPLETEETQAFCRDFVEAVSVCGQCIFTLGALRPGVGALPLIKRIELCTGRAVSVAELIRLGAYSRQLEQELRRRFADKRITSA